MVVGQAKKGVLVELGSQELLLPRSRYGAAATQIEEAGYGLPLTVEVVDGSGPEAPLGLSRVAIERSIRQPREIDGELHQAGRGFHLAPVDGSAAFAVLVLDRLDPEALVGHPRAWSVGAPYRAVRLISPVD